MLPLRQQWKRQFACCRTARTINGTAVPQRSLSKGFAGAASTKQRHAAQTQETKQTQEAQLLQRVPRKIAFIPARASLSGFCSAHTDSWRQKRSSVWLPIQSQPPARAQLQWDRQTSRPSQCGLLESVVVWFTYPPIQHALTNCGTGSLYS